VIRLLGSLSVLALAAGLVLASPRPPAQSWRADSATSGAVLGASAPRDRAPEVSLLATGQPQVTIPILEYHYIRVNPNPSDRLGFNLSVTPSDFSAQLDWLVAHGYHAVTAADVAGYFRAGQTLPAKSVVLTFDDGYEDFYTAAWPALEAHSFTAVAYIVPGFLQAGGYLTNDQVLALDRAGVEIGSHTLHHVDLTKQPPPVLQAELRGSRDYLEKLLGHPVLDFCYPSGRFSPDVVAAVSEAGYQTAVTEMPGAAHGWDDRLTWTRVRVMGGTSLDQFAAGLGG
jgi:peptidoglycan/xylan/chitin deacetylase (PgdA/CDA1 family)